jgi:magnesium-transporting ATPase (P-type)
MVDEALLTGENFPVRKVELPRSPGKYHQDADAQSTVRAGTIVLRTQSPFADTPALGMVMATGFGTSKGRLLRRIIYPGQLRRIFYSDALYFVLFMGIVALGMFGFSAAVFFK